jgi:hypothetical protein
VLVDLDGMFLLLRLTSAGSCSRKIALVLRAVLCNTGIKSNVVVSIIWCSISIGSTFSEGCKYFVKEKALYVSSS